VAYLPHPADPPEDRLKQLEILRVTGAISEQEFELHRADVLDALTLVPAEKRTVHPPL